MNQLLCVCGHEKRYHRGITYAHACVRKDCPCISFRPASPSKAPAEKTFEEREAKYEAIVNREYVPGVPSASRSIAPKPEDRGEANYMQVGRAIQCGHCNPKDFGAGLKKAELMMPDFECDCICHDAPQKTLKENLELCGIACNNPSCSVRNGKVICFCPCHGDVKLKEPPAPPEDWEKELAERFDWRAIFGKDSRAEKEVKNFIKEKKTQWEQEAEARGYGERMKYGKAMEKSIARAAAAEARKKTLEEVKDVLQKAEDYYNDHGKNGAAIATIIHNLKVEIT